MKKQEKKTKTKNEEVKVKRSNVFFEGELGNEDDSRKSKELVDGEGKNNNGVYLKINTGKNYVMLYDRKYRISYVHYLKGIGQFHCLGGVDKGGYAPDDCPICAKAKYYFDKKKESNNDDKKKQYNSLGRQFQTRMAVYVLAMKGDGIKEKINGSTVTNIDFENEVEVKVLTMSEAQWSYFVGRKAQGKKEEVQPMIEKYSKIIKTSDDFLNRGYLFEKQEGEFAKTIITPLIPKVSKPKTVGEVPDLDEITALKEYDELQEAVQSFLDLDSEDDSEEEKFEEVDEKEIEDLEDDEEDSKNNKKKDEESEDEDF